ncbi:DUF4386 domain-containing protein [Pseudarthrobacter sp. H2]|uniref:DUF4386 domain-containing protein n=1 Tax=Pseudarthrobacter sp. H2 TaxID=3418415 RepID=UPI003CF0A714
MNFTRKTALITGVLFIITIVFSIPGALLYGPLLNDPNYILGPGADTQVALGAFLEIVVAAANIGTAVVLFPILRRQSEGIALGYVASRIVESTIIAVGILSVLSVVTLRQDFAAGPGADAAPLLAAGHALVALHGSTFLLGPGLLAGFGNGLLLGYLMYRSGLVPRPMALLGLIGGPLVFASGIAVLFGLYDQVSVWSGIFTVPEFLWEASLGIYLIVKGFRASPLTAGMPDGVAPSGRRGAAG